MGKDLKNNFAFIDGQNLHLGIQSMGWNLDFQKFRVYLSEKYDVVTAYIFMGYIPGNQELYSSLQKFGYIVIFKPILTLKDGTVKGNVDADLVLQTMIDFGKYESAIIVSSDGDFHSLVKYLYENGKLCCVLSPYSQTCSVLLRKAAKDKIVYMDNLSKKLGYKKKNTA